MPVDITDLLKIVETQDHWRGRQTINLIASENPQSPAVRAIQNADFMARYAEGHPNRGDEVRRYYQGTRYIDQIETMVRAELLALTRCRQADVRPISGNAANTALALGYLRGGDAVVVNSTPAGGHISHNTIGVFGRRIQTRGLSLNLDAPRHIPLHYFPLSEDLYHIDVQKSLDLIEQAAPRLIVLGKSLILFPEPVRELAGMCQERGIPILYDAAHVFGLIVGGQFQDPWREGATWVTASTHKTFPGPQRGVIVADLDAEQERQYWPSADRGVFPGSSSNHHLHTLPALLVAIREMRQHATAYAAQIVRNAQTLGRALEDEGIRVEARDFGYTVSHQIAVNVAAYGGGVAVAQRLEANDMIVNYNLLPPDTDPRNPSGLRIGVQEMTRYGMREADMQCLAGLLADAIKGKTVREAVHALRARRFVPCSMYKHRGKTMGSTWRGIGLVCMLVLVASCSSKRASPAALATQPQALEQMYQDGRTAFKERHYDEAAARFARVVATDPENLKARLNWAAALSSSNKASEAIVQCQNVLARDPSNAEAYYQWGAVLVRLGKHQEAMEKFDQALALKPMTELLQDDPLLQQSLQAYLKRQRRQASDAEVQRPKPDAGR